MVRPLERTKKDNILFGMKVAMLVDFAPKVLEGFKSKMAAGEATSSPGSSRHLKWWFGVGFTRLGERVFSPCLGRRPWRTTDHVSLVYKIIWNILTFVSLVNQLCRLHGNHTLTGTFYLHRGQTQKPTSHPAVSALKICISSKRLRSESS